MNFVQELRQFAKKHGWEISGGGNSKELTVRFTHFDGTTPIEYERHHCPTCGYLCRRMVSHCKHGHPFDEKNTRFRENGKRVCKECNKARYKPTGNPIGRPRF